MKSQKGIWRDLDFRESVALFGVVGRGVLRIQWGIPREVKSIRHNSLLWVLMLLLLSSVLLPMELVSGEQIVLRVYV
jgi:hypothetical protein